MVLSYDTQTQSVVASILNHQNPERYECIFSACLSPVCGCQVIYIDLSRIATEGNDTKYPPRHVKIDLMDKSLGYGDKTKPSQDELRFAKLFLSLLTDDDLELLLKKHVEIKNRLTEEAKPDCIDAHFNYKDIELEGLMSGYNDVLPYADRLYVTLAHKKYLIYDQYCIKPNCSCSNVNLGVLSLDEVSRNAEEISCVNVSYKKREWSKVDDGQLVMELDAMRPAMEKQLPQFYDILCKRHLRLKTIYAFSKKKHFAAEQPLVIPQVGRNDPCPCGSGKKSKKCCL